jgi:YidC/Oxa1 family membrane protein insertase
MWNGLNAPSAEEAEAARAAAVRSDDLTPGAGPAYGEPGASGIQAAPGIEDEPALPADLVEAEPWRETFLLDAGQEGGRWEATFDNRGAVLASLKLDGYYTELGLDEVAKGDPAFWVTLCEEVDTGRGMLGSLALATSASSERWTLRDPAIALWNAEPILSEKSGDPLGVRFTLDGGLGVQFEKTIQVIPGSYDLAVSLSLRNVAAEDLGGTMGTLLLTPAMGMPRAAQDNFYVEPKAGVCWRKGAHDFRVEREKRNYGERDSGSFPPDEGIVWAGVDNKYFALLVRPEGELARACLAGSSWRTIWDAAWSRANPTEKDGYRHIATELELSARVPKAGAVEAVETYDFRLFAGPKDTVLLEGLPDGEALAKLTRKDLGFFAGIASALLAVLGIFHDMVGNWGAAIIMLTLAVRLVLFPINRRSQVAMARHATKMKRVQPRLNEAKEKYAKDSRRQREEQAKIMQEEGAFPPLGGCLPVFVQIPIFFGLFSALRASFDLRHAPFMGWIRDLSAPDRFMRIDLNLPLVGPIEYLNVLPPTMVVLWILQQRVMPKPTDPQAAKMQKMMMWMPILFGFFLYNYAAGLSLYMITTSVFGILEQTVIKKIWPIDDAEQPKKKGGFMDRLAKMQAAAREMEKQKAKGREQRGRQHQKRDKGKGKGPGASKGKKSK